MTEATERESCGEENEGIVRTRARGAYSDNAATAVRGSVGPPPPIAFQDKSSVCTKKHQQGRKHMQKPCTAHEEQESQIHKREDLRRTARGQIGPHDNYVLAHTSRSS